MNKYIAAFDGLKFSESTSDFAIALAASAKSHLTGIFLDDQTYTSYKIYDLVLEDGVSEHRLKKYKAEDNNLRHHAADKFEQYCIAAKISFNIHHDRNVAITELLKETLFSDLLIINNGESFTHHEEKYPTHFIRDVLSNAQSPVLLTPAIYKEIEKLIFLYDGQAASIYALKTFSYLFQQYKNLPVEVLCIKSVEENLHLPHNKLIKEFLKRHYDNVTYTVLKGIPEVEIINHLHFENKNFLPILGAYRRTMLSRWFKSSMVDAIIKSFTVPLFIAHNK